MTPQNRRGSGFSLIEVTFALGIAAFCLLVVSGLLTVGVQTNKRSTSQNVATNILAAAVSDLRATPKVALGQTQGGSSPLFTISLGNGATSTVFFDANGSRTDVASAQAYRLTAVTTNSGATTPTYARLQVTWPAAVDPATGRPDGSVETFAAVDLHY